MSRLSIELPEWVDEKARVFLVGGNEVIARKRGEGPWEVKTRRCDQCGLCCRNAAAEWPWKDAKRDCSYLELGHVMDGKEIWRCAHPEQPWSCVRGSGEDLGPENCCIRFEPQE
jgi:hypothetical protein